MEDDWLKQFKETVPKRRVVMEHASEDVIIEYYDEGTANPECVVMLPPIQGAAHCYYKQIMALSITGYRVVSISWPALSDGAVLAHVLDVFFDRELRLQKLHILGTGLGGYLAQIYAQYRPTRVRSLILVNSFCDNSRFQKSSFTVYSFLPEFMLQKALLESLPREEAIDDVANGAAIDFMVGCIEQDLPQNLILARLALQRSENSPLNAQVMRQRLGGYENITIIETLDEKSGLSEHQKADLGKYYYDARIALMKNGGSFPFLSRPEEFNVFVRVHLRRNRLDAPARTADDDDDDDGNGDQ